MKVTHITDIDKFFEVIDSCKKEDIDKLMNFMING